MLHLNTLTKGEKFEDSNGEIYIVTSNWGENKRIYLELDLFEEATDEIIND